LITRTPSLVALGWAALLTLGMAIAFSANGWPFVDAPHVLYIASVLNIKGTIIDAFTRDVEYRPLFTIAVDLLYSVVGTHLAVYKIITVAQFAAILVCLVRLFRITAGRQTLAAFTALSCFVGLHSSLILFNFYPISHHSLSLLFILVTAVLCLGPRRPYYAAVYFLLALASPLVLELGLLVPAVLVVLWWFEAPGLTRRDVMWGVAGCALYAVIRTTFSSIGADAPWYYAESGLGFEMVDRDGLAEAFGHAPVLFWIYNVAATLFTVLFSEPRAGQYKFIASLINANTQPWQWINVITSTVTTVVIAAVLVRQRLTGHRKLLVVLGSVLLLAGSLFGFLYTRDRIALAAGAGYAVLVFAALSAWSESGKPSRSIALGVTVVLLTAWTWRSVGSMLYVRDRAFESYTDWIARYDRDGAVLVPDAALRERLHADAIAVRPPDPRCAPEWTRRYFNRLVSGPDAGCPGLKGE
jgi:hypothetical protein